MLESASFKYPLAAGLISPQFTWRARAVLVADVLLVGLVAFLMIVRAKEFFNVQWLLLVVAGGSVLKNLFLDESWRRVGKLNLLDLAVTIVVGVELLNYLTSTYRPNTFLAVNDALFYFLFYWLIRFNVNREYQRTTLFFVLAVCGVSLAIVSLYNSWSLNARLQALGFADLTNFRNYIYFLNPIGLAIGVWCTVFFPLLCFPLILLLKFRNSRVAKAVLVPAISVILIAMGATFIRGVYIAVFASAGVLLTLNLLYQVLPVRTMVRTGLVLATLLILGLLPVMRPVMTTMSLFTTTSQVRSFKGRTKLWKDSAPMVKDHLWFGVGSGNFPMKHIAYRSEDDDAGFVLRPFNVLLQVLVEKGIVGLVAYGFLCFSFLWVAHRKIRKLRHNVYEQFVIVIFVTAFIGMIVRDMSESSILVNGGVGVILTYVFAHVAQSPPECEHAEPSH